jgi:hypothetical protein
MSQVALATGESGDAMQKTTIAATEKITLSRWDK